MLTRRDSEDRLTLGCAVEEAWGLHEARFGEIVALLTQLHAGSEIKVTAGFQGELLWTPR